jgi:hypothetical protein
MYGGGIRGVDARSALTRAMDRHAVRSPTIISEWTPQQNNNYVKSSVVSFV